MRATRRGAAILALTLGLAGVSHTLSAVTLHEGDILVADPGAGAVIRVDPASGAQTTVSSGGIFAFPLGIAVEADGNILVADFIAGAVIRVDPATGAQTTVSSGGSFINATGIAVEADGNILVVDSAAVAVIRVDPATGVQTTVSSGGAFANPFGIAVEADGNILVADRPSVAVVIRVDPASGAQTLVSFGAPLANPNALAVVPAIGPVLSLFGACPGTVSLELSNATPNGRLGLGWGTSEGSVTLPSGPCAGTEIGLADPTLLMVLTADPEGNISFDQNVGAGACGLLLQALGHHVRAQQRGQRTLSGAPTAGSESYPKALPAVTGLPRPGSARPPLQPRAGGSRASGSPL